MNLEEQLAELGLDPLQLAHTKVEDIEKELCERSMSEFIRHSWKVIEPGRQYFSNWHIDMMCEHLTALFQGQIKRLLINIPPRHMKSTCVSIAFPTWCWIHEPHLQFLFASYSGGLSIRDAVKSRRLLSHPWYQSKWGDRFVLTSDQNQKSRYENNHNGHRIATSVDGTMTGDGGDIIVVDDPHKVKEVESDTMRENVLEWWNGSLQTRLNDPDTGRIVLIMQRIHEQDVAGHVIKEELHEDFGWNHLCFPARYEREHPYKTVSDLGAIDPRKEEGQLLWPERFNEKALNRLERSLGIYGTAGQLQQRPSPKGGGILRANWWRKWERAELPMVEYVLTAYDTAYGEKDANSYSAHTSWGVFRFKGRMGVLLLERWRDRVPYPDLRKEAKGAYLEYSPDAVMVEKKASGQSLIQDLRMSGIPCIEYLPDRDKVARAHASSSLLEAGMVWYIDEPWAREVIDHCAIFPAGDGADIVDTCTMAWIRLRNMWFLAHPEDEEIEEDPVERVPIYG